MSGFSKKKQYGFEAVEAELLSDCHNSISERIGRPVDEVRLHYPVYVSENQKYRSRKGKALEDAVEQFIKREILPLGDPGITYERQSKSPEGKRRIGTNPVDGVIVFNEDYVLGVSVKVSGKAGGLQQILTQELAHLRARYSGRNVRILVIGGPEMSLNGWLSGNDWVFSFRYGDKETQKNCMLRLKFWLLGA